VHACVCNRHRRHVEIEIQYEKTNCSAVSKQTKPFTSTTDAVNEQ